MDEDTLRYNAGHWRREAEVYRTQAVLATDPAEAERLNGRAQTCLDRATRLEEGDSASEADQARERLRARSEALRLQGHPAPDPPAPDLDLGR